MQRATQRSVLAPPLHPIRSTGPSSTLSQDSERGCRWSRQRIRCQRAAFSTRLAQQPLCFARLDLRLQLPRVSHLAALIVDRDFAQCSFQNIRRLMREILQIAKCIVLVFRE